MNANAKMALDAASEALHDAAYGDAICHLVDYYEARIAGQPEPQDYEGTRGDFAASNIAIAVSAEFGTEGDQ